MYFGGSRVQSLLASAIVLPLMSTSVNAPRANSFMLGVVVSFFERLSQWKPIRELLKDEHQLEGLLKDSTAGMLHLRRTCR